MEWIILVVQTITFLLLCLLLFTIPGYFLLNIRFKNSQIWKNFGLSSITGFAFFTLLSYLLLIIHLNFILLIIILIIDLIFLKKEPKPFFSPKFKLADLPVLGILLIGIVGQLLIIFPSGLILNNNVVFWSAHGHDGVWHLSLVQELQKTFPFQNPDFAGQRLVNYHFFSDISIADFNYFFKFSSLDLYFRFFPILFSVLLGILSFQLGKLIGKTKSTGIWAFVFTFFAGSFGYIVTFLNDGTFQGENLFWSSQIQSVSGNPPQAIALVIVLAFILLLSDYILKPNKNQALSLVILAGTLAEFKIYGAIILLVSLFFISIWHLIRTKNYDLFLISITSTFLAALLYLPNSSNSESLLLFQPWWFIRTMVVATDKLNWLDLEHRRQTYLAAHSYIRVAQIETEAFLIFLFGNLGMRFLGFWQLAKSAKIFFKETTSQLIILILFFSLLLPMLFIQKGIPANTIQFFLYFLLLFGILAGVSTSQFLSKIPKNYLQYIVTLLIILLAIPTQIGLLKLFYNRPPFATISHLELSALNYLNNHSNPSDIIISPPFQKGFDPKNPQPPIWVWSDTSYVPAFSSRQAFVTDIEQLDIMGYDYHPRQETQKQIFSTTNPDEFENLLKQNQIKFIYFPKIQKPAINLNKTNLQNIFTNEEVEVWKVK